MVFTFGGGIFRIAFHPSAKKGKWYIGVACHGCGKPILLLEDAAHGKPRGMPSGPGGLSTPCYACGHDDSYQAEEMRQFRANRDIPSFRDKRPEPTNDQKEPFLPKHKGKRVTFGNGAIEFRPKVALIIARITVYWTNVETQMARLLAVILRANTAPAIGVYLSLKNARAKNEALEAAASLTLEERDYELFQALIRWKESLEKERNDIAHGVFGVIHDLKDCIAWVSTTAYAVNITTAEAGMRREGVTEKDFSSRMYVYSIGTLERIARDIETLYDRIGFFLGYLRSDEPAWRATRYPQLCDDPHLRKELDYLRRSPTRRPSDPNE